MFRFVLARRAEMNVRLWKIGGEEENRNAKRAEVEIKLELFFGSKRNIQQNLQGFHPWIIAAALQFIYRQH